MKLAMDRADIPLEEPLTRELKLEVKLQLEEYWKFHRRDLMFRRNTKLSWVLTENMITLDEATPQLKPNKLSRFCNKPTTLYLSPSGQRNNVCPTIILGCIYKDWFLRYDNEPNFEFSRFFADPVRITSTGPQAVADIVRSHKSLCDQASRLLTSLDRGEKPSPCCKLTTQTHKLLPLCRAIILVLDELDEDVEEDEDGRISLDEYSQAQSVLMVRTGDESHLSTPITFEHIRKQVFRLKRDDCDLGGIEVIRVSLALAVDFVTTLQQREDVATPSGMNNHTIDRSLCPSDDQNSYVDLALSADVWAEKILQQTDELGFENCVSAKNALIRALKARKGDDSAQLTPYPFARTWK
jgi:hypothetical protein